MFVAPDGTRLLLLPYGARVLGLYAAGSEENFFWTNPPLDDAETARELFARSGWHNTGGDRTWVAPELDTFFPDANSKCYWQPRQLDMSDYAVERTGGGIGLSRSDDPAPGPVESRRRPAARQVVWPGRQSAPLRAGHGGPGRFRPICRLHPAGHPAIARRAGRAAAGGGHLESGPASRRRRDARAAL